MNKARFAFAVVVLASQGPVLAAPDTKPPKLLAVELLDPTVNVIQGSAAPGVRLEISDGGTGLGRYTVHFQPTGGPGYAQNVSGEEYSEAPKRSGSVTIRPAPMSIYHIDGQWYLYNVTLCDRVNNCHQYVGDELDALLPSPIVTVVNPRSPDGRPPSASGGIVSTPTVSLGDADIRFRTRMTLSDGNSGVVSATVCFTSPSGNQTRCADGQYSRPAKGTVEVQEGSFASAAGVETGTWTVTAAYLTDVVGNYRSYSGAAAIDTLFPGSKTMTVTPPVPGAIPPADAEAPTLVSLKVLAPTKINVAAPPAAPTVRLEVTDDVTGLGQCFVGWESPNHMQYRYTYDSSEAPKKSGSFDIMAPRLTMYDQPGIWQIYNVKICDRAANCRTYEGAAIDAVTENRTVRVINTRSPDAVLPSASAAEVVTTSLSRAGNGTVRTRMTLDDDNSGVRQVTVCFQSPSHTQNMCTNASYSDAAKGVEQTQEGQLPESAETGAWTVGAVYVIDVPGNTKIYSGATQLDALFPGGYTMTVSP